MTRPEARLPALKSAPELDPMDNAVLAALSPEELATLTPHLKGYEIPRGHIFYAPDQRATDFFFITSGVVSLTTRMKDGRAVEVGFIGNEGVLDASTITVGVTLPLQAEMQVGGAAFSANLNVVRQLIRDSSAMREQVYRCLYDQALQMSQVAACNQLHLAEERLARWLLMVRDRVNADEFAMTHEYMAEMLGTRRSTVTIAAGVLQRSGIIEYRRGKIKIRSVEELKAASCECYSAIRENSQTVNAEA